MAEDRIAFYVVVKDGRLLAVQEGETLTVVGEDFADLRLNIAAALHDLFGEERPFAMLLGPVPKPSDDE